MPFLRAGRASSRRFFLCRQTLPWNILHIQPDGAVKTAGKGAAEPDQDDDIHFNILL